VRQNLQTETTRREQAEKDLATIVQAKRRTRDSLGAFLNQGRQFQIIVGDETKPVPEEKLDAWYHNVQKFISESLGEGYAARLMNSAGLPLSGASIQDNTRRKIWGNLNMINARLAEFISELKD
jgi:hypothetical protein